jgi:hypothetical protein
MNRTMSGKRRNGPSLIVATRNSMDSSAVFSRRTLVFGDLGAVSTAGSLHAQASSAITFTRIPPADRGGHAVMDTIEGRVTGAGPNQSIVIYSKSEDWWIQPGPNHPYTNLKPDSTWSSPTHLGTEYAVLLVEPGYRPPTTISTLPRQGGKIVAVAIVPGDPSKKANRKTVRFGGYEWTVRATPSDRGGVNEYDSANAWTDKSGALHLKIVRAKVGWTCAQVYLDESLGYGTYRFVVRDISRQDPAAVLAIYTWDAKKAVEQAPREWDFEFSRWGNPANKNAQYVVQPRELPNHTDRFEAPAGVLSHSIRWEAGKASFRTVRGADGRGALAYEHVFTAGVPIPASEKLRLNFYDFQRGPNGMQEEAEAIIDRFEFLP